MIKYLFLLLFLLTSCSSNSTISQFKDDLNFSNEMKLEDFKKKLEIYAKNSSYPNIDN